MKKSSYIITVFLTVVFAMYLVGSQSMAEEKIYLMNGYIKAIELDNNTVVIEVPLKEGRLFTVGGPLSSKPILKKSGQSVSLFDFEVGDQVTVKWKSTGKGHIIETIEAK